MTTREPRKCEVEGESYFFRTKEQFEQLIKEDAFWSMQKCMIITMVLPKSMFWI